MSHYSIAHELRALVRRFLADQIRVDAFADEFFDLVGIDVPRDKQLFSLIARTELAIYDFDADHIDEKGLRNRLAAIERNAVNDAAQASGMKPSAWARACLLKAVHLSADK